MKLHVSVRDTSDELEVYVIIRHAILFEDGLDPVLEVEGTGLQVVFGDFSENVGH